MNKKFLFNAPGLIILSLLAVCGCERNPIGRLLNPPAPSTTNNEWTGTWTLYDDEIKTGGGVQRYTTDEGQTLDFSSTENPRSGVRCIKFSWNGHEVTTYNEGLKENTWVGFGLTVADQTDPSKPDAKDLTKSGAPIFTKITFWARGTLGSSVSLRLEANNAHDSDPAGNNVWTSDTATPGFTSHWQKFEIPLGGTQTMVKDYVRIVLKYAPGEPTPPDGSGGTVYLDDIAFQ